MTMYICPKHQGFDPLNCPDCATELQRIKKEKPVTPEQAKHNSLAFKKIIDYSDDELQFAIDDAVGHCQAPNRIQTNVREARSSLDFWRICRGIDAFMEQRRRKESTTSLRLKGGSGGAPGFGGGGHR